MINKKLQQQWKKGKTMKEKRRGKKRVEIFEI
jgi:hypothetical protein